MGLREEMWKYEQITGESAEYVPVIKLGAFLDGYEMGLKALEMGLKALSSSGKPNKWIPVSERLPEVHESGDSVNRYMQSNPVLVYGTCEYYYEAQFHVVTYCDDLDGTTYWSTELDGLIVSGVIAWMPLPEPYRESEENE